MAAVSPPAPASNRRIRVAVGVVVWLAVCYASWYAALWLFPVPHRAYTGEAGAYTRAEAESAIRATDRFWWAQMAIYVVLCVLIFHLVPYVWRRWLKGGRGEVAG